MRILAISVALMWAATQALTPSNSVSDVAQTAPSPNSGRGGAESNSQLSKTLNIEPLPPLPELGEGAYSNSVEFAPAGVTAQLSDLHDPRERHLANVKQLTDGGEN